MGRPFDIARSNHVVTDYHTQLVQIIIALELDDLIVFHITRVNLVSLIVS